MCLHSKQPVYYAEFAYIGSRSHYEDPITKTPTREYILTIWNWDSITEHNYTPGTKIIETVSKGRIKTAAENTTLRAKAFKLHRL